MSIHLLIIVVKRVSQSLLISDFKLSYFILIRSYKKLTGITAAISADAVNTVFNLKDNKLKKMKHKNIFDYFSNEYQMTSQTVETNHFNRNFIEICSLGSGGFGSVVKVKHKFNKVLTAVKKIKLKG